ncbi:unnamed protein product [Prunus armeniaca]
MPKPISPASHLFLQTCPFRCTLTPWLLAHLPAQLPNLLNLRLQHTGRDVLTVEFLNTLEKFVTNYTSIPIGGKDTKVEKLCLDLVMQLLSPLNLNYHWLLRPDPPSPQHLLMTPRFWATQVTVALYFILLPQVVLLAGLSILE